MAYPPEVKTVPLIDVANNSRMELLRSGPHSLDLSRGVVESLLCTEAVDVISKRLIHRMSSGRVNVVRPCELPTPTILDLCPYCLCLQATKVEPPGACKAWVSRIIDVCILCT